MGVDVDRLLSHASAALVGGGLYLTGDDNLRITTIGALANAVLAIEGRLVTPEGVAIPIAERHVPSSSYATLSQILPMSEGILTHLQVRATSGAALRGHCFAVVEVVRGGGTNAQPLGTLLADYVTATGRLAWPGSPIASSIAGPGRLRSITGTDPAAGVEVSETVPAGVRWRLVMAVLRLTTDATVVNRVVEVIIDDGVNIAAQLAGNVNEPASSTFRYNIMDSGFVGAMAGSDFAVPIPGNLILGPGFRFRTTTLSLQAADNWAAPQYLVEEWLEG
jgi:hypothetical protein